MLLAVRLVLLLLLLAACRRALSAPPPPHLSDGNLKESAGPAPTTPALSPPPSLPSADASTPAAPRELTVCLAAEPQSLYLYARPEPGRDHVLAALYDGPIDSARYGHQPVLFEKLPSVADGDAVIQAVTVGAGDTVVDALGRVLPLAEGVSLLQAGGATITYSGSGSVTVPQMVVTFRLKPGVRWSDGAPLIADDSVFSFEVALSPDSHDPRRLRAERTASYLARDAATIEWAGLPGYLDPLYFTNIWPPLPRHVYGSLTPAEIAASQQANRSPLGWGPFVLREWASGERLVFERNPNYFRAAEGLPRLDRVTYRIVPPDAAALLAAVQAGECDVVPQNPVFEAEMAAIMTQADVQVVGGGVLEHLDFGISPAADYAREAGNDLFQEVRVRQAFAYCIDRSALASAFHLPRGVGWEPPAAYLPADHPLHAPPPLADYAFDPARGRALLAEAGWIDSDGDGVLDRDGVPLTLDLAGGPMGDPLREALLDLLAMQLKANCGIGAQAQLLTRGELEGDWPEGVVFGRRFDLALFGWRVGSVPPCELFITAQIPDASNPGGANDTGYSQPEFDAACRRALTAFDPGQAAHWHAEAQRLFARDLPMLPLFFRVKVAAARPQVSGLALDPTSPSELWNIEALTLNP